MFKLDLKQETTASIQAPWSVLDVWNELYLNPLNSF